MFFKANKFFLWVGLLAFVGFGCSSGGGSGGDSIPPSVTPATTEQGTVSQVYVKGATVFADKIEENSITGNFELDEDEVQTTSDQNGNFTLEVPADYGDYVICSIGGTITHSDGTEVPAHPMLAPAGASNITPITTLVALDPTLEAKFDGNYDADIADPEGTSGEILQLAKTVETILDFFCSNSNPIVTDIEDQFAIYDHIAAAIENKNIANDNSLVTAAQKAVDNILKDDNIINDNAITLSDNKDIIDTIKNTVETIVESIDETSNITEDSILSSTEDAVQNGIDAIKDKVTTVSTEVVSINSKQLDLEKFNLSSNDEITLSEDDASQIETLNFNVSGENEFGEDKTFSNAELLLSISDADSSRKLNANLTHVEVTVAADNNITFALSDNSRLFIKGRNSNGDNVHSDIDNKKDNLNNVFSFSDNTIIFDFAALQGKLGSDHDLASISLPGDYTLSLGAKHVPFVSFSATISVQ